MMEKEDTLICILSVLNVCHSGIVYYWKSWIFTFNEINISFI